MKVERSYKDKLWSNPNAFINGSLAAIHLSL